MTIEESVNDRIYFLMRHNEVTNAFVHTLQFGNYTGESLATEVGRILRLVDPNVVVSFIKSQGRLQIIMSSGHALKILSDEELANPTFKSQWQTYNPNGDYDINDPRSCNEVLKTTIKPLDVAFTSELLQLQPFHTCYLHSNLTTFDSMDAAGRRSIIARIPISVAFGYVNHWEGALESLWFDVSEMTFRNLQFSLQTARGRSLNLHGTHMSIHLVFD
jgi:hypothetical protein